MAVLHLLGTGSAFSDARRTTTMLAFESGGRTLVVDCGGDVIQRLLVSGVDLAGIEAMIVTHEHADHVGGFPLFMEKLWLSGRRDPIPVYGIEQAIGQARRAWESFDTKGWKGVPEIQWHPVKHEPGAEVLRNQRWHVTATPGIHPVPVVGLRVELRAAAWWRTRATPRLRRGSPSWRGVSTSWCTRRRGSPCPTCIPPTPRRPRWPDTPVRGAWCWSISLRT